VGAVKMVGWMARPAEASETLRTKSRREVVIVVVSFGAINIGSCQGFSIIFMEMSVMAETKPNPPLAVYLVGIIGVVRNSMVGFTVWFAFYFHTK
jgi:hypothetical protein